MRKLKLVFSLALFALSLMPWNAVALNGSGTLRSMMSDTFDAPNQIERLLVKGLLQIADGQLQSALNTIDQLIRTAPNFKLAYFVRGDLLMARAQQINGFGGNNSLPREAVKDFREEAKRRIDSYIAQQKPRGIPDVIWQLDAGTEHVAVIDAEKSRLYFYKNENGRPIEISNHYITLGKNGIDKKLDGDKRTPIGVYLVGSRIKQDLPDFYGDAAYPLDYPNAWDAHQKKTGSGIWIHGTPSNTYSRPPLASDGCIVMANPELQTLKPILERGSTLVIVSPDLHWTTQSEINNKRESLAKALDSWRRDWESLNTSRYLTHYSPSFFSQTTDYAGWAAHKKRVQATAKSIRVDLSGVSMVRYPDKTREMAEVRFKQSYQSDAIISSVEKLQYWIMENGQWKILYEGS